MHDTFLNIINKIKTAKKSVIEEDPLGLYQKKTETKQEASGNTTTTPNTNAGYTMQEVLSVAETGALPVAQQKSAYDMYMDEAKNLYNLGVEENNKAAANQAAAAGAEYRELNRNVGEINKANGRADTGYAGDTSIEGYNAYRNSVNASYSNADKANNELYSYYLSEMTRLQEAKDNKEMADRELAMREQEAKDNKETKVVTGMENILLEDGAFDGNGNITSQAAQRALNYAKAIYGDNIPASVMAYLEGQKGFSEWYNGIQGGQGTSVYDTTNFIKGIENSNDWVISWNEAKSKVESLKGTISDEEYNQLVNLLNEYAPTSNNAKWSVVGLGTGATGDFINIKIGDETFKYLACGDAVDVKTAHILNGLATGDYNTPPSKDDEGFLGNEHINDKEKPGKLVVYQGKMYLYTKKGWVNIRDEKGKSGDLDKCISAYLKGSK